MADRPRRTPSNLSGPDRWQMEMAMLESRRTARDEDSRRARQQREEQLQREEEEQLAAALAISAAEAAAEKAAEKAAAAALRSQKSPAAAAAEEQPNRRVSGLKRKARGELDRLTYSWFLEGPVNTDPDLKSQVDSVIDARSKAAANAAASKIKREAKVKEIAQTAPEDRKGEDSDSPASNNGAEEDNEVEAEGENGSSPIAADGKAATQSKAETADVQPDEKKEEAAAAAQPAVDPPPPPLLHQPSVTAQVRNDRKLARRAAHELNTHVIEARTRLSRVPKMMRTSFSADEFQLTIFPLADTLGNSVFASRKGLPLSNPPGVITPTRDILQEVYMLFRTTFSNVTFQTLKGHAAVVLMDEHNYRLKKTNSSNRAGSDKETPQPFSTLVCAGVFDLSPHMLGSQSQIIFRISYFATVEKWAGRGFAKLLLTHLKEQAASMARSTGKEVTMVLLSLAHTLKFWTSKSMGLMAGGLVAQLLSSLNYSDTTMCSLPVLAASQGDLEAQRQACIECVRERLKQPQSALTIFPRFQGQEVRTVNIQPSEAAKETADAQHPRNVKARSSSDESSSSSDDDDAVPQATTEMLRGVQLLRGNALPSVAPRPASQRELASFMQLVALAVKRECGVPVSGCPPAQHAHTQADDFSEDELCVAAVQQSFPQPMGVASFTLERCSVMARWPGTASALLVQLLDRSCPNHISSSTAVCCVVATYFVYKLDKQ